MVLVMVVSLPVDVVDGPNSQQSEAGFIPEIGLCAATISLFYVWSRAPAITKVRRIMTGG
jgi:hypothetical protein